MAAKKKGSKAPKLTGPAGLTSYNIAPGTKKEKLACKECKADFYYPVRSKPGRRRERCRTCHYEAYGLGNKLRRAYKAAQPPVSVPPPHDPTKRTKSGTPKRTRKPSSSRPTSRKTAAA